MGRVQAAPHKLEQCHVGQDPGAIWASVSSRGGLARQALPKPPQAWVSEQRQATGGSLRGQDAGRGPGVWRVQGSLPLPWGHLLRAG